MKHNHFKYLLFILVFVFSSSLYANQPRSQRAHKAGDIKGVVSNCGLFAADMDVYIRGTSFHAITDSNGNYYLSYVQAGTYDLTVKQNGTVIGSIPQVIVKKRKLTQVDAINLCEVVDNDGDGFSPPQDCNDNNPAINPNAIEICGDGIDNDCNGQIENISDGCSQPSCTDADNDGFFAQDSCGTPVDCDDASSNTFPGAPEQCDGLDNDCDNIVDEGLPACNLSQM